MSIELYLPKIVGTPADFSTSSERVPMSWQNQVGLAGIILNRKPWRHDGQIPRNHNGYSWKYRIAAAHVWLSRWGSNYYCHDPVPCKVPYWIQQADAEARHLVAVANGTAFRKVCLFIRADQLKYSWYKPTSTTAAELHENWSLAGWVTGFPFGRQTSHLSEEQIRSIQLLAAREIIRRFPTRELAEQPHPTHSGTMAEFRHPEAYTIAQSLIAEASAT